MLVLAIVLLATLVKLAFMGYLGGQVYGDGIGALNFAFLVVEGPGSIRSSFINDKTFIGPLLWFWVFRHAGVAGLLAVNVTSFLALCAVGWRLGRGRYDGWVCAVALLLFAFYVGTHRNIVAGEQDDNLAALCLALGVLAYLESRRAGLAGLAMGLGFLFKFWIPIFAIGFAIFLASRRRWRELGWALIGMAAPFFAINCLDGLASLHALWLSLGIQHGYSSWRQVVVKLFSTGLLPIAVVATLVPRKRAADVQSLFWLLTIAYPIYVVLNRDAFSASFVLMVTMLFAGFPLAEALLAATRRLPQGLRAKVRLGLLATYLAGTTVATHHNLRRDTIPIVIAKDAVEATRISRTRSVRPWCFNLEP
jgi:hypothetical protein